jgi:hypothetical protein
MNVWSDREMDVGWRKKCEYGRMLIYRKMFLRGDSVILGTFQLLINYRGLMGSTT